MRKIFLALSGLSVFALAALFAAEDGMFPVLATKSLMGKQTGGFYILPTNQLLRPWGEQTLIKGRPVDMAFDSDKHLLAVLNGRGVDIFDAASGAALAEIKTHSTSYNGIAFRPAAHELWVSETGDRDDLFVQTLSDNGAPVSAIRIEMAGHPVPCGIAFSPNGDTAYVALSRQNTVAVIDARSKQIVRRIDTGIAPWGVLYGSHNGKVFVTNRGGRLPKPGDTIAPSSGSEVVTDAVTGASSTGTMSVIDVETHTASRGRNRSRPLQPRHEPRS